MTLALIMLSSLMTNEELCEKYNPNEKWSHTECVNHFNDAVNSIDESCLEKTSDYNECRTYI